MYTIISLCIGRPKTVNFPFVPNGKLMVFRGPKIYAPYGTCDCYYRFLAGMERLLDINIAQSTARLFSRLPKVLMYRDT